MKNGMPTVLGATRHRSERNEEEIQEQSEEIEQIDQRLDRVEAYAKIHAGTLTILAAQALGVPTQELISVILSIL